ncbi:MAG TPA: helix-turn-helix domain-containing protein [Gaiellaceae bacterium]|nr:helix-turn-helix domain-containing protein [Gaiellaceae bacterium]
MTTPDEARDALRREHELESDDAFGARVDEDRSREIEIVDAGADEDAGQLVLLPARREALPLSAYLASALTGLSEDQRRLVFHLSDTVAEVCRRHGIDVYEPRKATDPVHHAGVPAETVWRVDRERVVSSDVLIHLGHFPSTGAGEELDFAYSAMVPIVLISHGEMPLSRMVTGIPGFKVEITYVEPEELRFRLEEAIIAIRPALEERKLAFSGFDKNIVGEKIRTLRQELGMTREEVAAQSDLLTEEMLARLEESTDRVSNPSLSQLRIIAATLKTTVADLVEPDLGQRVVGGLLEWMHTHKAARFPGMSARDSNRVLRRILLRVIEAIEEDLDEVEKT